MNNKQATFETLDSLSLYISPNVWITSIDLNRIVRGKTGSKVFVATCLRYLRLWNTMQTDKKCVCVNNKKSLYQIIGDKE